jgi:hypothetical protein
MFLEQAKLHVSEVLITILSGIHRKPTSFPHKRTKACI